MEGRGRPGRGGRLFHGRFQRYRKNATTRPGKTRGISQKISSSCSELSQTESLSSDFSSASFINTKAQPLAFHNPNCPFPGWLLYFPTQTYEQTSKSSVFTKVFISFITKSLEQSGHSSSDAVITDRYSGNIVDWSRIESQGAVLVDFSSLMRSVHVKPYCDEIGQLFGGDTDGGAACAERCEMLLQSLGLALHTVCYNAIYKPVVEAECLKANPDGVLSGQRLPGYISGRIINYSPTTPLRKLRAHHLGRFISIRGIVIRLGHLEPLCHRLAFECCQCSTKQILILPPDGRYSLPTRCPTRGCRSRSFDPLLNDPDTITNDTQLITVQEACDQESDCSGIDSYSSATSVGRSPRCLTCRLSRDLVDLCIPGDVVQLTGMVSLINAEGSATSNTSSASTSSSRRGSTMFSLILEANSLVRLSGGGGGFGSAVPARTSRVTGSGSADPGLLLITSADEEQTVSVDGHRDADVGPATSSIDSDFSIKDLYAIREISEQPNLFRLLVASFCPSICARGLIKAGLLLALFGGTQSSGSQKRKRRHDMQHDEQLKKDSSISTGDTNFSPVLSEDEFSVSYRLGDRSVNQRNESPVYSPCARNEEIINLGDGGSNEDVKDICDQNEAYSAVIGDSDFGFKRRSTSHVLIVGDPGLGKSQMLRAAASLAPRVIYVCGNTASAAGLTVSTIREGTNNGGGFGMEAGALILADQGCCCIDEFDKLACDPAVLLEAMEQQTISVARGGLVANLPARTAVLAAANPIGGHYDSSRSLDANLRIAPALLSRFDLIFVLLDRPDEVSDRLLSEHVTAVHTGTWKPTGFAFSQGTQLGNPSLTSTRTSRPMAEIDPTAPLAERLAFRIGEHIDYIPHALLRKYILYARKYVMPNLSRDAAITLRDFYLELRRTRHNRDTFPVTLRQLESLVRLTEARARAELREQATREDALDACELMRATGLGSGRIGELSSSATLSQLAESIPPLKRRITSSTGPAAAKRLLATMELASKRSDSRLFTRNEVLDIVVGLGFGDTSVEILLDRLTEAGALLRQNTNLYRLI